MQNWDWKRERLFRPSFKSNTSSNRLAEFHSKLVSYKKPTNSISIPTYQALKNQIKGQASFSRFEKPKFDYYSDIASFRSISPKNSVSPVWRTKPRHDSIFSNISGTSTPRISMNLQVIRMEELKKAIQVIAEMNDKDFSGVSHDYITELYEFSKVISSKLKNKY